MKEYRPRAHQSYQHPHPDPDELMREFENSSANREEAIGPRASTVVHDGTGSAFQDGAFARAKTAKPTRSSSPSPYCFPARDGGPYTGMSDDALMATLTKNIRAGFNTLREFDYASVRGNLCNLHLELNRRVRWAPRFRGMPRIKEDEDFMRDRQVVDLHWLAGRYENHAVVNREYESVLAAPFDFTLAEAFACAPWHAWTKTSYLGLWPSMEWELAAIQSEAVRKRWLVLQDGDLRGGKVNQLGAKQVRSRLMGIARQKALVPNWVETWTAASICDQNWVATARMLALMTGREAPDPRQVARTFSSIRANLKKADRT